MDIQKKVRAGAVVVSIALGVFVVYVSLGAQAQTGPRYVFDPGWPKPLPNKWKMGGVTGLAVDPKDDTVWAYDRPNDLTSIELEAELTPPIADCCTLPPSMIHFDKEGTVIGSFQAPQGHGMDVDSKGFAYLGQNTVRKYDTKTGKLVGAIEHTPDLENGGKFQEEVNLPPHTPGRGGMGPVAGGLSAALGFSRGIASGSALASSVYASSTLFMLGLVGASCRLWRAPGSVGTSWVVGGFGGTATRGSCWERGDGPEPRGGVWVRPGTLGTRSASACWRPLSSASRRYASRIKMKISAASWRSNAD